MIIHASTYHIIIVKMSTSRIALAGTAVVILVAVVITLIVLLVPDDGGGSEPFIFSACNRRLFSSDSVVCVCNASYCDNVERISHANPGMILIYTSTKSGQRFKKTTAMFEKGIKESALIVVNTSRRYQTIKGFGGAFTDAAGINIASLDPGAQEKLLHSYFGPDGIQYNLGRIPMASCDFSTRKYTYNDNEGDLEQGLFSLQEEDRIYKIPFIHKAMDMNDRPMSFYGSPWSAPAWMKTNNNLTGKGSLKGEPGGDYYRSWALYFSKFIEEYEKEAVPIWGITAQNEPSDGQFENFPFQCMGFSPEQQRDFIKLDLGPTLKNRDHEDIQIMIMDDQRLVLPEWPEVVLNDSEAEDYVDGIAVHWYMDFLPAGVLSETHNKFPNKFILASEACNGATPGAKDVILGDWGRGEKYSADIIEDIRNWVTGWVDWNLALNMNGGPNWVENFVDSPIIVDAEAGEFYKQPMYYHLGHFSKFVPEGSIRIDSQAWNTRDVDHVAFINKEDNTVTLIILNKSEMAFEISIQDPNEGITNDTLPERSIRTYRWFSTQTL